MTFSCERMENVKMAEDSSLPLFPRERGKREKRKLWNVKRKDGWYYSGSPGGKAASRLFARMILLKSLKSNRDTFASMFVFESLRKMLKIFRR